MGTISVRKKQWSFTPKLKAALALCLRMRRPGSWYNRRLLSSGVWPVLGPQLIAEIGDVRRFHSKIVLIAFAGY